MGRTPEEIGTRLFTLGYDDATRDIDVVEICAALTLCEHTFRNDLELIKNYVSFDALDTLSEPPYSSYMSV
jgi:hypothetical protein